VEQPDHEDLVPDQGRTAGERAGHQLLPVLRQHHRAGPPEDPANVFLFNDDFESGSLAHWSRRSPSASAWYNYGWAYRKKITLTAAQISGTQSNFPVMIDITDAGLAANAQANGNDVLFTAGDGVTKLDHQTSYASATGTLTAWVRMPTLSSTTNTLYLYYGNAGAADQRNATGVWTGNNHRSVWHLGDNPTKGAPQFADSSPYANHGTNQGSIPAGNQVAGKVGKAISLNPTATSQFISTTNPRPTPTRQPHPAGTGGSAPTSPGPTRPAPR
jgi:hypothetical protein